MAFAADNTQQWWEPGLPPPYFWPFAALHDLRLETYVEMFRSLEYRECARGHYEPGYDKIAIYGAGGVFKHVARQEPRVGWKSKLGGLEDIEHRTLGQLEVDQDYGRVVLYMRRRRQGWTWISWVINPIAGAANRVFGPKVV